AQHGAAAAERPDSLRRAVRIAVAHRHRLGRHAELVRDDLGECGLVALAVSARARDGEDRAGRLHANLPALPAEARRLDVRPDAAADRLAAGAPRRLRAPEPGVVGDREGAIEEVRVVAGVVDLAGRGLEREARLGDQIATAQLDRIDLQGARGLVDEPL